PVMMHEQFQRQPQGIPGITRGVAPHAFEAPQTGAQVQPPAPGAWVPTGGVTPGVAQATPMVAEAPPMAGIVQPAAVQPPALQPQGCRCARSQPPTALSPPPHNIIPR